MPKPSNSALPLKLMALTAVVAGLVGVYVLQAPPETDTVMPPQGQASASAALPGAPATPSTAAPSATSPPLKATDVAQAYADSRKGADARYKGQRMQLQGVIHAIEQGQEPILLITMSTQDHHPGMRAVVDADLNPSAKQLQAGQDIRIDCLNQGLVMDEPLLSDCRVLP